MFFVERKAHSRYFPAGCVTVSTGDRPSVDLICRSLKEDQQLATLFSENFVPVNCRSSLEGVWQFTYQVISSNIYLKPGLHNDHMGDINKHKYVIV